MRIFNGFAVLLCSTLILSSCTIYDKIFDNPVDFKANIIGSFIVFKDDSTEPFSGLQLQIEFPNNLIELDTILPGLFLTDTSQSTPLFTYTYIESNLVDIFAYFLGTTKLDIDGTGHLADLIFSPLASGKDSIFYHLNNCTMINHEDDQIEVNGIRSAEIIIE